jgi:hypothetical protein
MSNQVNLKEKTKKIETNLKEIGQNSVYRNHYKRYDAGLNNRDSMLYKEGYSQAEKCFLDPQVSTCFLLSVFEMMSKKIVFTGITGGKKTDIKKSKELAKFLQFSLDKLENGGVKQLQLDLALAKFFGFSLIEKVYGMIDKSQSILYENHIYYKNLKAKRTGLWDFVYDEFDNITGFKSLVNNTQNTIYPKERFLFLSYLPKFGNFNGTPDFDKVWKFWDAKTEFIIASATLSSRLAKGKQIFLKGTNNGAVDDSTDTSEILEDIAENLAVYIPLGYDVIINDLNSGVLKDLESFIKYFNSEIAVGMLGAATSVNESQGSGTNAQSEVHMKNQKLFQNYFEGIILDCIKEQYAKPLLKLNYDYPEEIYPDVSFELEKEKTVKEILEELKDLKLLDVLDTTTEIDVNYIRQIANLPENPELFEKIQDMQDSTNDNINSDKEDDLNNNENTSAEKSISQFYNSSK